MNTGRKVSLKNNLLWTATVLISSITTFGSRNYTSNLLFYNTLTTCQSTVDTIPKNTDTLPRGRDTNTTGFQRIDTIDVKISKDSLDAPVTYAATDSMVLDIPAKKIRLYNQGTVKYKDLDLSASHIEFDQQKQVVNATFSRDSLGKMVGKPRFIQGENNMEADEITYDLKSQ